MPNYMESGFEEDDDSGKAGADLVAWLKPALARWKTLLAVTVLSGALGIAASFLVTPKFTAVNTFLPPQQQQGGAVAALASLSNLAGLVGGGGSKNSPEQYISLMQSVTASDRIIGKFGLKKQWNEEYGVEARQKLGRVVQITANKKDSLIKVEVTMPDPVQAAAIANQYVAELRRMTNELAVTEAQQRRAFFQQLMEQTRDKLAAAQTALEGSGYSTGALNSEPKAAAEGYARLRAELTAAQVKLQVLRGRLADTSVEVVTAQETVNALSAQLGKLESEDKGGARTGDYVNRYREFKYQETLFELFARQYESARVDESHEGALIQVVDPATPPEKKSSPKRSFFAAIAGLLGLCAATAVLATSSRRGRQRAAESLLAPR